MAEFKNPNQQGGGGQDNSSLLIMMVVMVGIFFGLQYFRAKNNPPAAPSSVSKTVQQSTSQPTAPAARAIRVFSGPPAVPMLAPNWLTA